MYKMFLYNCRCSICVIQLRFDNTENGKKSFLSANTVRIKTCHRKFKMWLNMATLSALDFVPRYA